MTVFPKSVVACQAKRRVTDQRQASFFQIWVRKKSKSSSETGLSESCGYGLLPKERQRHQGVRVPREQWHETGARESPVELVPHNQSTSKNSTSGSYSSLSALEQIKDIMVRAMIVDHPN